MEIPENFLITETYNLTVDAGRLGSLLQDHQYNSYHETIDYLDPNTLYEVKVAAVNSAGIGAFTSQTILTHEDIPGSQPISVTYTNLSSTTVNITWKEPVKTNGVITHYTVGVIAPNAGIEKKDSLNNFLVLENLKKYSPYEVRTF